MTEVTVDAATVETVAGLPVAGYPDTLTALETDIEATLYCSAIVTPTTAPLESTVSAVLGTIDSIIQSGGGYVITIVEDGTSTEYTVPSDQTVQVAVGDSVTTGTILGRGARRGKLDKIYFPIYNVELLPL